MYRIGIFVLQKLIEEITGGGNVCTIFSENFFILEKGYIFAFGGEDSEYNNRDSF